MTATTPQPADLRVGRYRLLTKIGEGGMGVVHLAQAPDGNRVALKVLRPHIIGDDEARQRLEREVASLRRVTSPRVAEVLDADPWGETPFVATRYVPGLSLHQHVREEGAISGEDLAYFAAGLAEAVVAVHRVGVLHRDIKPSNVLLEGRAPVLIDFGLARLAEDSRLTHTGWLLGTPGYLAPEILYGEDATTASDVHSWAATVAFAASGRPPFGTGPAMAVMDRVRRGEHDLSGVPSALLSLVRSGLAPEPADRPDTAAVLGALRAAGPAAGPGPAAATVPLAVATAYVDDDPTEVLGDESPTRPEATVPRPASPPTTPLTTAGPPPLTPAREPFMQPPPPQQADPGRPRLLPPDAGRPAPAGLAALQRSLTQVGLGALVACGFARAPYLALLVLGLATLGLRTISWTTEAARERQHYRGRRRWYDGALTVATAPWYLVVAAAGTVLLLTTATVLALAVGVAYLLFRPPLLPGLLVMGAVIALSLWWGPGARRVRAPVRRLAVLATRNPASGWAAVGVVGVALVLCAWFLSADGVLWSPAPGPPWRAGTVLGDLVRWL